MTTPFRATTASDIESDLTPPASPRASSFSHVDAYPLTTLPSPPSSSTLPRRIPSRTAIRSTTTRSNLRVQTLTRLTAGNPSTPRTRLARGGPPRASVRQQQRRPRRPPPEPPTLVRYHFSTLFIVAVYLPLLTIPWVIICILDIKPLTWYGTSYHSSGWYTPNDVAWVPRWVRASNILGYLSAMVAFPVITSVLGHASAAFVQNVRAGQKAVNARELLALADGCWMRIVGQRRNWLASVGTTLLVLGIIIPLLQVSAVRVTQVQVAACNDVPYPKNTDASCHHPKTITYKVGGYDPEPADMALTPGNLVARKVRNLLPTFSDLDTLSHIWPTTALNGNNWVAELGNTLYYYQKTSIRSIPFYVSTLPQGFNTGVLREHAMRFNSTATCETVSRTDFPDVCPGTRPLFGYFSNEETQNRFCVPGSYVTTPWTIERSRQDIVEELWVDNYIPYGSLLRNMTSFANVSSAVAWTNATVHCVARTTRGYFELPNIHNDGTAGDLLADWPSRAVLEADFNDVEGLSSQPPAESDPRNKTDLLVYRYGADPYDSWNQSTPGPLTVLINAMLGEESWFYPLTNATTLQEDRDAFVAACVRGLPLSVYTGYFHNGFASANFGCSFLGFPGKLPDLASNNQTNGTVEEMGEDVSHLVAAWFSGFTYNASTQDALEAGMYLANEALLTLTADASKIDSARPIYVSQGTTVFKPDMRNPSKAIVSFLVLVEIAGLGYFTWFCYRMPTFASRLDAVDVATIGVQLTRRGGSEVILPPLGLRARGREREKYLKGLEEVDGLIGVQEEIELTPLSMGSIVTPRTSTTLTVGAQVPPAPTVSYNQSGRSQQRSLYTPSPAPSLYGGIQRPSSSLSQAPRAVPYATSAEHTADDDLISTIMSEEPDDPDGPPKYGDVIQADAERAARGRRLVVGGAGRITKEMAKVPTSVMRRSGRVFASSGGDRGIGNRRTRT